MQKTSVTTTDTGLSRLGASEAARLIRAGEISSEELVGDCLARISAFEDTVQAWTHVDPQQALALARELDKHRQAGRPLGALHGVPVGVKDIVDTSDMPTEYGTPLYQGRSPGNDATLVSLLRAAGAIVLGKTVTTEMAVYTPGKTRNPHDPGRSPGGSSSGSAAAVAAYMAPLAVGTQTNGSVVRPAAYCGVVGFKPSHGLISRHRVLKQSRLLDHIGVFARDIPDAALLAEQLIAFDERDPDSVRRSRPPLLASALAEPPAPPRFAFVKTPHWGEAESDVHEGFGEMVEHLGAQVEEIDLDSQLAGAAEQHRLILEADLARSFAREYARGEDGLSARLREMIERGQKILAVDYNAAEEHRELLRGILAPIFEDFDAILTPAATGEAPQGLDTTGSPIFCTIWTLCGLPALSLPLLRGSNDLPVGVQLVGPAGDDARLLRTAAWLSQACEP